MDLLLVLKALYLLTAANGTPVVAKKLLGNRFAFPVDGGRVLRDGRPLFGPSKTIRGLLLSAVVTAGTAPLIGVSIWTGAVFAVASMTGDLLSSFIKRRLGMAPSSMALGLDQVPESLLPLVVCGGVLGLGICDVVAIVALFIVGELLLSRLLFRLHIRERPY